MLDNASDTTRRSGPPAPRNRPFNRKKSGDRFDRANFSHMVEGDKSQPSYLKNPSLVDHGEAGLSNFQLENTRPSLIPLEGCSKSEAAQLLHDRVAEQYRLLNDPLVDPSEKPFVYSGSSGSSWVNIKLPHQMDFMAQLRHAIEKSEKTNSAGSTTKDDN